MPILKVTMCQSVDVQEAEGMEDEESGEDGIDGEGNEEEEEEDGAQDMPDLPHPEVEIRAPPQDPSLPMAQSAPGVRPQ